MNYRIALTAIVATAGLAACDSHRGSLDRNQYGSGIESGTTTAAPAPATTTTATTTDSSAATKTDANHTNVAMRNHAHHHANHMKNRAAKAPNTEPAAPTSPSSGSSSPDANSMNLPPGADNRNTTDVYHNNGVSSGTTSEPYDSHAKVIYKQTPNRGGIAPQDRNLRYGLVGNGTGTGFEDTTSKFMTDNWTISDPLVQNRSGIGSGVLSAPTDDQDALKDIKSGTTFDSDYYDIRK